MIKIDVDFDIEAEHEGKTYIVDTLEAVALVTHNNPEYLDDLEFDIAGYEKSAFAKGMNGHEDLPLEGAYLQLFKDNEQQFVEYLEDELVQYLIDEGKDYAPVESTYIGSAA